MTNSNSFKKDADRIMKDIVPSRELREKTLRQMKGKRINFLRIRVVSAACAAAVLLIVAVTGAPFLKHKQAPGNQSINSGDSAPNIMMALPDSTGNQNTTLTKDSSIGKKVVPQKLSSLDEAKSFLEGASIIPSYVPQGFELNSIEAVNTELNGGKIVYLFYMSKDSSIMLSAEVKGEWKDFSAYRDVDINNNSGHIRTDASGQGFTELKWFEGNILYSLDGMLSEEDAIRMAESMR